MEWALRELLEFGDRMSGPEGKGATTAESQQWRLERAAYAAASRTSDGKALEASVMNVRRLTCCLCHFGAAFLFACIQ